LFLLVVIAGCGGDDLRLAPVTGVVTLDDEPVAGAAVLFMPVDGGPVATASTDENGRFTLSTTNRVGAVIGEHRVSVNKSEIHGLVDGMPGPDGIRIEWIVPEKYSRVETSGLVKTVNKGQNEIPLHLKSP